VIPHRRSAQGPLPKSRTTEQSHDFDRTYKKVTVTRIICGVDVCKDSLEARIGREGAAAPFSNRAEGIAALADFCREQRVELVAMEATGGYEQQAFAQLSETGLPVRGGRASVRDILFIVASAVGRYEPDSMAFQQRLRAAGKPPKVVRIALAYKLLVRLNAKAREVRQRMTAPHPASSALLLERV
jgi:transposase